MIVTNLGSMGVCKSAMLIYYHLFIERCVENAKSNLYVAFYDKNREGIPIEYLGDIDTVKVVSRICEGKSATLIDDDTEFNNSQDKINTFSIDEAQFICDSALTKLVEKGKENTVNAYCLNTDYQNIIWPKTRKLCLNSDFIYMFDGEFARSGKKLDSNYMFVNNKFELEYKTDVKCGFDGCTEKYWYDNAVRYFRVLLSEFDYDVELMLKEKKGLTSSFIKLFQLWEQNKIYK